MLMCISLAHEAKQVPSHFKAQKLPRMKIQAHGLVQIMIPWWHRWPSPRQLGHLQYGMAWIGRPAVNGLVQYADTFMETFQHFLSCCPYLKIYIDNFINALIFECILFRSESWVQVGTLLMNITHQRFWKINTSWWIKLIKYNEIDQIFMSVFIYEIREKIQ